jgi:tetratricopeptide (TPR) repeat protein
MPSLAGGFSARAETAADLGAALVAGGVVGLVPVRVAGDGPGGWLESCGKTQVAVSVAESMWESGRLDLLVWATASSRASVLSCYAEAAVAAAGADPGGRGEASAGRFAAWLAETDRPWLVVLDDVRDPADLEGLWPQGPAGRVLITTANPAAISRYRAALVHPVGVFTPGEALTQLAGCLAAQPGKRLGAEDLAAELGYEPLALAHASAVIATSALSCRDYLDCFARKRAELAPGSGHAAPAPSVTWAVSAGHAERLSPGAGPLLRLAALLDGQGIPGEVFVSKAACEYLAGDTAEGRADPEWAREALLAAERAGLLSVDPAGGTTMVRISKPVQAAIRAAAPAGTLDRAAPAAADALLEIWPEDDPPACLTRSLRSCAGSLREGGGDPLWADGCHPVLVRAGQSLDRAHLHSVSVRYWSELAALSDRILGQGHPDALAHRERLAAACLAAGRAGEAVSWFQWVLAERVRVLGPGHPSAIAARRDVGHALLAAKEFGDAITVLDRVVADCERVQGADHPATLTARDRLAAAFRAAGRSSDAIRLYRQNLAGRERVQGAHHAATIATRQQMAGTYLAMGRHKDAIAHYEQALADCGHVLGPDHHDTITARGNLASAYHAAGRLGPALRLSEQARADAVRVWGPDHPGTLTSSANLALAYYQAGRMTDAMALLRDTAARCERALPPGDPLTRAVRESLASIGT